MAGSSIHFQRESFAMEKQMQNKVLSIFFIILGLSVFLLSFTLVNRTVLSIGPGFMPKVVGVIFVVLGFVLFIQSRVKKDAELQDNVIKDVQQRFFSLENRKFILAFTAILLILYVGLLEKIGFPLMTALYLTFQFYILAEKKNAKSFAVYLGLGIVCSALITLLFTKLLGLFLPLGIFE
jgi:putative tricarboxylic transport membrane protein